MSVSAETATHIHLWQKVDLIRKRNVFWTTVGILRTEICSLFLEIFTLKNDIWNTYGLFVFLLIASQSMPACSETYIPHANNMAHWVGAQGQAKLAKKSRKHAPLWRHPQKTQTTNEKNALNLQSKTCWIRRWFEQLSSSIGWRVVALQTFQKMQKSGERGTQRVYFLFFKRIIEVLCLFHLLWQRTHQVLILKFYLLSTDANT